MLEYLTREDEDRVREVAARGQLAAMMDADSKMARARGVKTGAGFSHGGEVSTQHGVNFPACGIGGRGSPFFFSIKGSRLFSDLPHSSPRLSFSFSLSFPCLLQLTPAASGAMESRIKSLEGDIAEIKALLRTALANKAGGH